jgi:hypothetical protein
VVAPYDEVLGHTDSVSEIEFCTLCCSRTMNLGLHIAVHARKKSFLRHTAEKTSTLLVDTRLRKEYEALHVEIANAKDIFTIRLVASIISADPGYLVRLLGGPEKAGVRGSIPIPGVEPLSRCTQFPESRLFVFNPSPGFNCIVTAPKSRTLAL